MEGKYDGMHMKHPPNKNDKWPEANHRKIESYKRVGPRVQRIVGTQTEIAEAENNQSTL